MSRRKKYLSYLTVLHDTGLKKNGLNKECKIHEDEDKDEDE